MCIFHAFQDEENVCVVSREVIEEHPKDCPDFYDEDDYPSADITANLCLPVLEAAHAQKMDAWQKWALIVGVTNSLLNPIIYGFWYSEFRLRITKAWRELFSSLFCCR